MNYKKLEKNFLHNSNENNRSQLLHALNFIGEKTNKNLRKVNDKLIRLDKYSFMAKTKKSLLDRDISKYNNKLREIKKKILDYYQFPKVKLSITDSEGEIVLEDTFPEFITIGWLKKKISDSKNIKPPYQILRNRNSILRSDVSLSRLSSKKINLFFDVNLEIGYKILVLDINHNLKKLLISHPVLNDDLTYQINIRDNYLHTIYSWWNNDPWNIDTSESTEYLVERYIDKPPISIDFSGPSDRGANKTIVTSDNVKDVLGYYLNAIPTTINSRNSSKNDFNRCMKPFIKLSKGESLTKEDYPYDIGQDLQTNLDEYNELDTSPPCPDSCFDSNGNYDVESCSDYDCLSDVINYCSNYIEDSYISWDSFSKPVEGVIHTLYRDQSGELRKSVKLLIGGIFYRFIDLDKVEIENSKEDNQYVLKVASSEPQLGYHSINLDRLTLLADYKQLIKYNY